LRQGKFIASTETAVYINEQKKIPSSILNETLKSVGILQQACLD
jgi:hypothetical protein